MPLDPEFIATHVLVPGDNVLRRVLVDDGVDLLHFEALQIEQADAFAIGDDMVEIKLGWVQVRFGGHGQSSQ